jgi:acetyl esterase/lipase
MDKLSWVLAFLSLGLSSLNFFQARSPAGILLMVPKVLGAALTPFVGVLGLLGAGLGYSAGSPLAMIPGIMGIILTTYHIRRVTASHYGFEKAFGPDWEANIQPQEQNGTLKNRWNLWLPRSPQPCWQRNVPYRTFSNHKDNDVSELLCDIWHPMDGSYSSGLAVIYIHGSAYHAGDKDMLTRPFFRHLVAQGHVVMDIAYRLCPEADIFDMVDDVRHAILWMKASGNKFGVDSERIVLGGGSAGGHLALLVGYTQGHPELTDEVLKDEDTSVRAVFSYYGVADTRDVLEHARRVMPDKSSRGVEVALSVIASTMDIDVEESVEELGWISASTMIGNPMGGKPEEVPEVYELASPITHVSADCPPTLLIQGEHDIISPAYAVRKLHQRLVEVGVPSVYLELPQTNHGFDLILPQVSPAALAALYDLDRFLALMV